MEPKIEVLKVSLGKKGKVLAYSNARVTFGEGEGAHSVTLSSLKVVDGAKGKFVDVPARKFKEDYVPFYFLNKALKDAVTVAVLEAYEREVKNREGK